MFHHVDEALEALLRSDEPSFADASISFDEPDEEDAPTLCLTLRRVTLSAKGTSTGSEIVERDGEKVRRQRLPNVELAYGITSHAGSARDQHRALAGALRTFLRHSAVPPEHFGPELVESGATLAIRIPKTDIEGVLEASDERVSLDVRITVPFDLDRGQVLADAPGTAEFGFEDRHSGATSARRRFAGEIADPAAVGVDVIGPAGTATVDADGRFAIVARPGDQLTIMLDPAITVEVPDAGRITVD